jgi:anti-anti-sigma regulatory factor
MVKLDHAIAERRVLIASARGTMDPQDARLIGGALEDRLTPSITHVVLDVNGLDLPESSEAALITAMLDVRRRAHRHDAELIVVACGEQLDRLVGTTALDELITIARKLPQALEQALAEHGEPVAARR